jgi:hypothetical protein
MVRTGHHHGMNAGNGERKMRSKAIVEFIFQQYAAFLVGNFYTTQRGGVPGQFCVRGQKISKNLLAFSEIVSTLTS